MNFSEIQIGDVRQFERTISREDIQDFARLTGDYSPLHLNPKFGAKTEFGQNIVHGMLLASLFSTLVGMHWAGKESVYLSQTIQFKLPVFIGDKVLVQGTVTEKYDSIRTIRLKTRALVGSKVVVDGEAKVKVYEYT